MKKCPYCGLQNPDEAMQCTTCHTPLNEGLQPTTLAQKPECVVSSDERRFWEHMTFRGFALLLIRLQALWLLVYGVIDATYLPRYFSRWRAGSSYASVSNELSQELALMLLRVVFYVAAALALLQYGEKFLSWLVRDLVAKQPPSPEPGVAAVTAPDHSDVTGSDTRGSL